MHGSSWFCLVTASDAFSKLNDVFDEASVGLVCFGETTLSRSQ